MIPAVGTGLVAVLGLNYLMDGGTKGVLDGISDILKAGNKFTRSVCNKVLSPTLNTLDRGVKSLGRKYQEEIDDKFS